MDGKRLERIEELYHAARERDPAERVDFLREACGDDEELRADVEALLAQDAVNGPLERPAWATATVQGASEFLLPAEGGATTIGRYRLLEKIGEGGMGEVWLAEQMEPVRRRVALKLVKTGMNTREVIARFESERQALALMDHPVIATVFDAGSTEQGMPYFAMEYVDGVPMTTYCDNHRLTIPERLELFVRVCEGVQHAHQKAIIHRDLKPSNILVTEVDGRATPKIIDFGIAKALTQKLTADTIFTRLGAMIGTPEYMSPEQALSSGEDIDTRTDVYSLGIILYELLTGAPPIELRKVTLEVFLRRLREEEPSKLSTRIRTQAAETWAELARKRQIEPLALARQLRGDLDSIALKALEKDRSRRYGSPSELAGDIERYLRNELVLARRASTTYRLRKYVLRHRIGVAVTAGLVLLLAGFAVTFTLAQMAQIRRITRERDRADRIASFMTEMFMVSDPNEAKGNTITAREILDKASKEIDAGLAKDPELQARMMDVMGTVYRNLGIFSRAHALLARAADIRRGVLGPENATTLSSMAGLSGVLFAENRFAEAEKLLRETLAIQQRVLGREKRDTLVTMSELALTLDQEGRYPEAEKLHRETLDIQRRVLGAKYQNTLTSMLGLANTLANEGRYADAEKLYRETVDLDRHVLGQESPQTLSAMGNLANTLDLENHYAEAEKLYREVIDIERRVLGAEHPSTLMSVAHLANVLSDQGHYAEAEKLQRETLDIRRRVLGPSDMDVAGSMYNIGCLLALQGRRNEAFSMLREAIDTGLDVRTELSIEKDSDLKSLHGDPRFADLVAHASERAAALKRK